MHASQRTRVPEVHAGDIVATTALKFAVTGDTLCAKSDPILYEPAHFPETVMSMAIEPKSSADRDRLAEVLKRLEKDDPTFESHEDVETGQTIISGMGELHLEVLKNRMLRDFAVEANVGSPRVSYRQTVRSRAVGEGLFEQEAAGRPQFGRVGLRVEPLAKPEGFEVEWEQGALLVIPRNFHEPIENSLQDDARSGAGAGYPMIGVKVTVTGGEFRDDESSELAFEVAASRAMENAVEAGGRILLEPLMRVDIRTPNDYVGEVLGDLNRRRATILGSEPADAESTLLEVTVPLVEMFGYVGTLRSLTQGRAGHSMEPMGFQAVDEETAKRLLF
jgi:elongation factor G